MIRIGTAGWSIPRAFSDQLPGEGSHLQRYTRLFNAAEINSSFHRSHRRTTYERWAASVPDGFRFAVKLPKTITHQRKLVDCDEAIGAFAEEVAGLGDRRGPILVQLPPRLEFDPAIALPFFERLALFLGGTLVCEPRHPSWFDPAADAELVQLRVARVAADPSPAPGAADPGGWQGLTYTRWHGSPAIYRSSYGEEAIAALATRLRAADVESWAIFDNTASGAATGNALALAAECSRSER
jgi:uncharacterized protein YecE (DUF72 family)